MSTSFRISQTGTPTPAGGFLGALGMTTSSGSLDIVAETDEAETLNDVVNFIQDVAGTVSGAYIRITGEPEDVIPAEVVDDDEVESDEPDTTDHDEAL